MREPLTEEISIGCPPMLGPLGSLRTQRCTGTICPDPSLSAARREWIRSEAPWHCVPVKDSNARPQISKDKSRTRFLRGTLCRHGCCSVGFLLPVEPTRRGRRPQSRLDAQEPNAFRHRASGLVQVKCLLRWLWQIRVGLHLPWKYQAGVALWQRFMFRPR